MSKRWTDGERAVTGQGRRWRRRSPTAALIVGCLVWLLTMPSAATRASASSQPAIDEPAADGNVAVAALPGWKDDDLDGLHRALQRQCALAAPPPPWPALCARLPPSGGLRAWIEQHFVARAIRASDGGAARERQAAPAAPAADATLAADTAGRDPASYGGLLTGYFEPILHGTRQRSSARQAPVYGRPDDLVAGAGGSRLRRGSDGRLAAYPTRAQIETHGLAQAPVLCWLDDPIDAFFLHIQGSGRVLLPDGRTLYLGFADHNGQRYRAIGRELVRRGAMPLADVTADSIRTWLRAHPERMRELLHSNPRYIFFRELPARPDTDGPPGALGVALEPGRSVATDPAFIPPGSLLYLDSTHPDSGRPLRRTVVSQDRGAAITGAVRVDLFWGSGDEAGRLAGLARQPLDVWLLTPRRNIVRPH